MTDQPNPADNRRQPHVKTPDLAILPPSHPQHDTPTLPPPIAYRVPTTRQLTSVSQDPRDWTPAVSQTIGRYCLYTPRSALRVLLDAWEDMLVRTRIKQAAEKQANPTNNNNNNKAADQ